MMELPQVIVSIDGLIGAGKSTIIKQLKKDYNCFEEPLEKFTLLSHVYQDPQKYETAFQFQVLLAQYDQWESFKNIPGLVIVERCPWTSRHVFAEMNLDNQSLAVYDELYLKFAYNVNYYIYLETNATLAFERICYRNRFEEQGLTLEYLEKLEKQYKRTLCQQKDQINVDASGSIYEVEADVREILEYLSKV